MSRIYVMEKLACITGADPLALLLTRTIHLKPDVLWLHDRAQSMFTGALDLRD